MSRCRPGRWAAVFAALALATGLSVGVVDALPGNPGADDAPGSSALTDAPAPETASGAGETEPGDQKSETLHTTGEGVGEGEKAGQGGRDAGDDPPENDPPGQKTERTVEQILEFCRGAAPTDPSDPNISEAMRALISGTPVGQVTVGGVVYNVYYDATPNCALVDAGPRDEPAPNPADPPPTGDPAAPPTTIRGCTPTVWQDRGLPLDARPTGELFHFQGGNYALFTDEAVGRENCWLIPAADQGTVVEHACTRYRLYTVADGQIRIPYGATEVPCRHHEVAQTRYKLRSVPSGPVTVRTDDSAIAAGRR